MKPVFSQKFIVEFPDSDEYFTIDFVELNYEEVDYTDGELADWLQEEISKHIGENVSVSPIDEPVEDKPLYTLFGFDTYYMGNYEQPPEGGNEWKWQINDEGTLGLDFWKSFLKPFTEVETKSDGIYTAEELKKIQDEEAKYEKRFFEK